MLSLKDFSEFSNTNIITLLIVNNNFYVFVYTFKCICSVMPVTFNYFSDRAKLEKTKNEFIFKYEILN